MLLHNITNRIHVCLDNVLDYNAEGYVGKTRKRMSLVVAVLDPWWWINAFRSHEHRDARHVDGERYTYPRNDASLNASLLLK